MILEAAEKEKCRILLQNGWTKYAPDNSNLSEFVFVVGNIPHDWLFLNVCAVVHHGGAGTTSAGLRAGRPTFICPFFGDQHFWAEMVRRSGCGPAGCPIGKLTVDKFSDALSVLLNTKTESMTKELSAQMLAEDGVTAAVRSFHNQLPLADMLCEISIFQKKSAIASIYCSDW